MRALTFLALCSYVFSLWTLSPATGSAQAYIFQQVICTPDYVDFDAFAVDEDGKRIDGVPYDEKASFAAYDALPGLFTKLSRCVIGGHDVRINFVSYGFGSGECGGVPYGFVSVWLDGAKIVDRRQYNWYPNCRVSGDAPTEHEPRLSKITLDKDLRLTQCSVNDWDSIVYGKPPKKALCKIRQLSGLKPEAASVHVGKIKLTRPGFTLTRNKARLCKTATRQLNSTNPIGGILNRIAEVKTETSGTYAEFPDKYYTGNSIEIDVDNDGVTDRLTNITNDREGWVWVSGKSGRAFGLSDWYGRWNNQLRRSDYFRFVRISGKIYALHIIYDDYIDYIPQTGARFRYDNVAQPPMNTHNLFELRNDGTYDVVCAWTPRARPEEFL